MNFKFRFLPHYFPSLCDVSPMLLFCKLLYVSRRERVHDSRRALRIKGHQQSINRTEHDYDNEPDSFIEGCLKKKDFRSAGAEDVTITIRN